MENSSLTSVETAESVRLISAVLWIYFGFLVFFAVGSVWLFCRQANDRHSTLWQQRKSSKLRTLPEQRGSGGTLVSEASRDREVRDRDKRDRYLAIERRMHPRPVFAWFRRILISLRILRF